MHHSLINIFGTAEPGLDGDEQGNPWQEFGHRQEEWNGPNSMVVNLPKDGNRHFVGNLRILIVEVDSKKLPYKYYSGLQIGPGFPGNAHTTTRFRATWRKSYT